jgi:FlgD Ig-like domain
MSRRDRSLVVTLSLLVTTLPLVANAQWQPDGVPICTQIRDQEHPVIVSDGGAGTIIVWDDRRVGGPKIFAQRVDASGVVQWTADGVPLTTLTSIEQLPVAVSDGSGGAIVAWLDDRNGFSERDVYAQRIDGAGNVQWASEGVPVYIALGEQAGLVIVSDGAGGAIIAWRDGPFEQGQVRAQRLSAAGVSQWPTNGVVVSGSDAMDLAMVSDGAGGAIIAWRDFFNVHAQRLTAAGVVQWPLGGVLLFPSPGTEPAIAPDDHGGAILACVTSFAGTPFVMAQRLNATGAKQWGGSGVSIGVGHNQLKLVPEAGGAIAVWRRFAQDDTLHINADIYTQRVNSAGVKQWPDDVAVTSTYSVREHIAVATDRAGGAWVSWVDARNLTEDIYAQRVSSSGTMVWDADGIPVCTASDEQSEAAIVDVGFGTGVVTWQDRRPFSHRDIYAQRVPLEPTPVSTTPSNVGWLGQNVPNPFNPTTTIRFVLPSSDRMSLTIYTADGRLVRTLLDEVRASGPHEVTWDGRDDRGETLSSGVYFYQLRTRDVVDSKKMLLLK